MLNVDERVRKLAEVATAPPLAPSAFLASAAGTLELQRRLLDRCDTIATDPTFDEVMQQWLSMSNAARPTDFRQRAVDNLVVEREFDSLFNRQTETYHRARLLAAASEHSGDWLHAIPITACGLRLDYEAIRMAVGLRLGCTLSNSPMPLWRAGRRAWHSWPLLQTQRRQTVSPSLHQRHHMASLLASRSTGHQGTRGPCPSRWQTA